MHFRNFTEIKTIGKEWTYLIKPNGGSFTNAIACDMEGYDLDICEIDKDYFNNGVNAFNKYKRQTKLFWKKVVIV